MPYGNSKDSRAGSFRVPVLLAVLAAVALACGALSYLASQR